MRAQYIQTGETVALKKVPVGRIETGGIPISILREVKALQVMDHPNARYFCLILQVIRLRDVFPSGNSFILVFDYMLSDLSEVLRNASRPLTEAQVKAYMMMLLKGVAHCHSNGIIHRDLKPANLLVSPTGILKLAGWIFLVSNGDRLWIGKSAYRGYDETPLFTSSRDALVSRSRTVVRRTQIRHGN